MRKAPKRSYAKATAVKILSKKGAQPLGFAQSMPERAQELEELIEGLEGRLRVIQDDGTPAAYAAERVFTPGQTLPDFEFLGRSGLTKNASVLVSADDHLIPIRLQGPGSFSAKYLVVQVYAEKNGQTGKRYPVPDRVWYGADVATSIEGQTVKWADVTLYDPSQFIPLNNTFGESAVGYFGSNFFWNLEDTRSSRRLSNDLIPDSVLLNPGYNEPMSCGLFKFSTPWLFTPDSQLSFTYRPINPIIATQADGSTAKVTVRVELHGTKFYRNLDLLRMGGE